MSPLRLLPFFMMCLICNSTLAQSYSSSERYRIMFYNLENLFDTHDDQLTQDDEFTPNGERSWTWYRYEKKLNNIAKVILALGEWDPPAIVGLCEVENFQVLLDLLTRTPLEAIGYQIIHENSRDERGIDVAMLYRPDLVSKIKHEMIGLPDSNDQHSRDILYVQMLMDNDTLHIFVNHWPSRFGGKEQTETKRIGMSKILRNAVDILVEENSRSKIILMGDFNDEPSDISLRSVLEAEPVDSSIERHSLYNLSFQDYKMGRGTLVFKNINNTWFMFDQIIVSGTLLGKSGVAIKDQKNEIFGPDWLMRKERPYRTYQGPIYLGGYSDHLPIFIDLCNYN
jgi:hypothetical protein